MRAMADPTMMPRSTATGAPVMDRARQHPHASRCDRGVVPPRDAADRDVDRTRERLCGKRHDDRRRREVEDDRDAAPLCAGQFIAAQQEGRSDQHHRRHLRQRESHGGGRPHDHTAPARGPADVALDRRVCCICHCGVPWESRKERAAGRACRPAPPVGTPSVENRVPGGCRSRPSQSGQNRL